MKARRPNNIWVIFEPQNGPHIFTSKKKAWDTYRYWEKIANDGSDESYFSTFWNMSDPTEYTIKRKGK